MLVPCAYSVAADGGAWLACGVRWFTRLDGRGPRHTIPAVILSQTAIYALRALAVLKDLAPGESLSGSLLSERTGVPRDYLAKVMRQLSRAGIVRGQRGHGGGFCLRRPPQRVRLLDVLTAVDTELSLGRCAFRAGVCNQQQPCVLHGVWSRFQESVGRWASETTVADLGPEDDA